MTLARTPLYDGHVALHAKLVDFAGWEMPIQYTGVLDEYHTVRSTAGLFDVSHMGRLRVSGSGALAFLQYVTTNNVAKLEVGQAQYSAICNPQGGIKDDIFVYRTGVDDYLLCVNASNREKIVGWLQEQRSHGPQCLVLDQSGETAQLALQGSMARGILEQLGATGLGELKFHGLVQVPLCGVTCWVARTGYTGEPGYELYVPAVSALALWNRLVEVGQAVGLKAAGLGARDLLRLDMGYLLYGNDISEDTTPIEAGIGWAVDCDKGDFIGRDVIARQKTQGPEKKLVGFELLEKGVPRHGFPIREAGAGASQAPVGEVASGNLSPLLQKGIGMGYVPARSSAVGTVFAIDIRGKLFPAQVVKPPFYKRPAKPSSV
jgi:aminomethyltransferase